MRDELELLPGYLASHLLLSVLAISIGIALSLPFAFAAVGRERLRGPVLAVASAVQTIPGLALLALMVPLLVAVGVDPAHSIGLTPALIALVLYSMLPVLRNAITGMEEVDPNLVTAAVGLGMTTRQVLWRVRLPLALPVIVAGIRTATVWVVGTATLATPVGATCLGNYIFSGLQTQNHAAVLVGCVSVAALALSLDLWIRWIELALARGGHGRLSAVVAVGLALVAAGLAPLWRSRPAEGTVRLGTKTFTEQYVLGAWLAGRLEAAGLPTARLDSLGSTVVFEALANGRIDVYVDYTGTIWANHMERDDVLGAGEVLAGVTRWLRDEHGIVCVGPLGFEDAYALAMRSDRAAELGVTTLEDLAAASPRLSIGGDYEFFRRPEWAAVRDAYGLRFAEARSFDSTLMYTAVREGAVDVIAAFSSDGRIAAYDLHVFEDPREALPPYDAVVLASAAAARRDEVMDVLHGTVGVIDDETMRRANMWVDVDGASVEQAAARLERVLGAGR